MNFTFAEVKIGQRFFCPYSGDFYTKISPNMAEGLDGVETFSPDDRVELNEPKKRSY